MLNERRIVITSDRLNRLSACVQAANAIIYPMHWQHIFIPLLPSHLLEYLTAPMPFLIGVPQVTLAKIKRTELVDIVLLNADTNQLTTPFDDVSTLPSDVLHNLRKALKQTTTSMGDGLCRAFMRALVSLIGGYRNALRIVPGEQITFNRELFVSSVKGTSKQLFLEKMLQLQIFQQFIETRLDLFNAGQRLDDKFEIELNHMEAQTGNRFKTQYREWTSTMRKEGGAFLRAVNPKVKSVFFKTRQAMRNIISNDNNQINHRPTSAPSSPKLPPKIKKSISGTAISQTSRTVTYVRTPNVSFTAPSNKHAKRTSVTFSNNSTTLLNIGAGNSNLHALAPIAPSASSESSDVDEIDSSSVIPRVDMNITAELENIYRNKAVVNGNSALLATTNNKPSMYNGPITNSVLPIPPPRIDKFNNFTRHTLKPAILIAENTLPKTTTIAAQEKCLIEFDSPPKDVVSTNSTLDSFDPLLKANYSQLQTIEPNFTHFDAHKNSNDLWNNIANKSLLTQPLKNNTSSLYPPSSDMFPINSNLEEGNTYRTSRLISHFELLSTANKSIVDNNTCPVLDTITTGQNNNNKLFQQAHNWQEFD